MLPTQICNRSLVRAGQAGCWYSCRRPPRRSRLRIPICRFGVLDRSVVHPCEGMALGHRSAARPRIRGGDTAELRLLVPTRPSARPSGGTESPAHGGPNHERQGHDPPPASAGSTARCVHASAASSFPESCISQPTSSAYPTPPRPATTEAAPAAITCRRPSAGTNSAVVDEPGETGKRDPGGETQPPQLLPQLLGLFGLLNHVTRLIPWRRPRPFPVNAPMAHRR